MQILSVTELTMLIKGQLETGFPNIWVEGEITGWNPSSSGHCYFCIKDANAQISCNLWRSYVQRLRFKPQNGQRVLVRGSLNVYPPRGSYSLNVQQIEPKGVGELALAFEQLKRRLADEGLFEAARKRPLPFLARKLGIVTSPTGAAIQDLLNVIHRRDPGVEVVIAPARVQGQGAAQEVAKGIERLNRYGALDVIIVARGGGSMEDLWCFNEEVVARAIHASRLPVVSAVGHEVDFTIADFVADLRAPTPSAAAELVVKDRLELETGIRRQRDRLRRAMLNQVQAQQIELMGLTERLRDPRRRVQDQRQRVAQLEDRLTAASLRLVTQRRHQARAMTDRLVLLTPMVRINRSRGQVDVLTERLEREMLAHVQSRRSQFERAVATLDALSPLGVLGRGYAIAQRRRDGRVIQDAGQVQAGDEIRVRVHRGTIDARVEATDEG